MRARNLPELDEVLHCPKCGFHLAPGASFSWGGWVLERYFTRAKAENTWVYFRGALQGMVLQKLIAAKGRFVNKDELFDSLYSKVDEGRKPGPKIIHVAICTLRKDLAEFGFKSAILTEYGLGWRLQRVRNST